MKKIFVKILAVILLLFAAFIYYYIALPAINIHSMGTWIFVLVLLLFISIILAIRRCTKSDIKSKKTSHNFLFFIQWKELGVAKYGFLLAGILLIVLAIGTILSSPIINAKKYQKLMTVEERNFTDDITPADFNTIPILDKDSATLLGDRKMGSMVDMVSQFEVSHDYTQINVNNRPVRVTPLSYASPIKWLTNQSSGIPAYIKIDMATQNTECVKLTESIKYSKSEYFNRNIYRHLRFQFPTYIFDEQIFFEIDDNGTPYWICPVKKFNIGLFGGQTIGKVVICNAINGNSTVYDVDQVPEWIDKVYRAELLMELYNYNGTLKHGYFNSILGQRDCLQTTNGYNYIALNDDVWVYSGVTSVSGDQSNVGFVLINQRTMETHFYKIEGATEESAMSSAEGQVQNLGYHATFPLLLNIANEPTYFMALKDDAGLVKKYAMVNIQKYQWVATGDTIKSCEKAYNELLANNGISASETGLAEKVSGKIQNMMPVIIEGNSHIYMTLERSNKIFDIDMTNKNMIQIVTYNIGDRIQLFYLDGEDPVTVTEIK
ncbi:MAG: CvpA family protein [Lachnospiraceae bacterium]|nr:CvpA family protein [Lachnospiraceae bacterium]